MRKRFLITMTLLGTLGLAGVACSQSQRPASSEPQHQTPAVGASVQNQGKVATTDDSTSDTDTEVQDDQVPQALKDVGEYGERVYDMAKVADWTKAEADLATLEQANQQLGQQRAASESGMRQLNSSLDQLNQAVAAKDQLAAQRVANQVTLLAAQMTQQYQTKVPVEVTLLDYYGRQLEVDAASRNMAQLQTTTEQIAQTWNAVRGAIVDHGGTGAAQQFDALVAKAKQAKSVNDYDQIATPILDQVDQLEAVFK